MPLVLIMGRDNTMPDASLDAAASYKLGDIVSVLPDTNHNGDLVANPIMAPWYLVRVTEISLTAAEAFLVPEFDPVLTDKIRKRARYTVEVSALPAGIKATLQADRYIERTFTQIRTFIRDHKTGLTV